LFLDIVLENLELKGLNIVSVNFGGSDFGIFFFSTPWGLAMVDEGVIGTRVVNSVPFRPECPERLVLVKKTK